MDFFLEECPHDGFNEGKEIAKKQAQKSTMAITG